MSLETTKRAGRPKLSKDRSRHVYLAIRLTAEEDAELKASIAKTSERKSDWIRKNLLSAARRDKSFT